MLGKSTQQRLIQKTDKLRESSCHSSYEIQKDALTLKKKKSDEGSVFFTNRVKSGGHSGKFQIVKWTGYSGNTMTFGVWKMTNDPEPSKLLYKCGKGRLYGWRCHGNAVYTTTGNANVKSYGSKIKEGDVVEMILDLNDYTLRYKQNDKDLGIAFKNIEKIEYIAAASTYPGGTIITLLSYSTTEANGDDMDDIKCDNAASLQGKVDELRQSNDAKNLEIATKDAIINSLKDQISGLQAENKGNEQKYKRDIDGLNRKIAQLKEAKQREMNELNDVISNKDTIINSVQTQNEGLKTEKNRIQNELSTKKENEQKYETEIDALKRKIATLNQEKIRLEQDKQKEIKELNDVISKKDATISKLSTSNVELNEECKELKHDLQDLRAKYDELKRKNINEDEYMNWNSDTITDWIVGLDENYKQYEEKLRKNLKNDQVMGEQLPHIDKNDLRGFGIHIMKDRIAIIDHVQRITTQKQQVQEIAAPAAAYSQSQYHQNDGPDGTHYINK